MNHKIACSLLLFAVTVLYFSCLTRITSTGVEKRRSFKNQSHTEPIGSVYIIIDKSDYSLNVFDEKGWFATYPVVFGNKSLDDKMMQGDRKTPEGTFTILNKRRHDKWNKFLLLDYPNKESWKKFKQRKAKGLIPVTAIIGGSIGIHGTLPHFGGVVDGYSNWTAGCISLKNEDLDELYEIIIVGTKVIIRK